MNGKKVLVQVFPVEYTGSDFITSQRAIISIENSDSQGYEMGSNKNGGYHENEVKMHNSGGSKFAGVGRCLCL